MKIVQINSVPNGSTGKIMININNELEKNNIDSYVIWGRGRKSKKENEIYLNDKLGVYFHVLYSRLTGKTGFASKKATKKIIEKINEIKPDIIHLHNIHGYYINIELLFNYIKKNNIKVIWTLHDCWSFTGHCPHFTICKCKKWMKTCNNCPRFREYPKSFVDNSKWNFNKKKELFTGLNMVLVTPSKWLANLVKQSFLKDYPVKVINNGIDFNVFKPTKSNFREKYNIKNKKIILGVAGVWGEKKGLNDFIKLSEMIDDSYIIVLIGLNKKQIKKIPNNIIGITRTENQQELACIYSTADVFFNPTYEDNYPTVNIESVACGTPVITYNTGGSPESMLNFGFVAKDLNDAFKIITEQIKEIKKMNVKKDLFINNSVEKMVDNYIHLYEKKGQE